MAPSMQKLILSQDDLCAFQASDLYQCLLGFIEQLSKSAEGRPLSQLTVSKSQPLTQLSAYLDSLETCIPHLTSKHDATNRSSTRFGSLVFRDWVDLASRSFDSCFGLHCGNDDQPLNQPPILPQNQPFNLPECAGTCLCTRDFSGAPNLSPEMSELKYYFTNSFGSPERIDFGTGHELNFVVFLYGLRIVNFYKDDDLGPMVNVFFRYIRLTHGLQNAFWLEPAGSHGVWGLDDYCFLPFYFGSAQLTGHRHLKPGSILYKESVEEFKREYFYFHCIDNINKIKNVPLALHSPLLYDITSVKTWDKVNQGLLKMYKQEFLNKLPVMQHLKFGSVFFFAAPDADNQAGLGRKSALAYTPAIIAPSVKTVYEHDHKTCCVNKIPSAIAARVHMKTPHAISDRSGHHFIPFD